MRLRVAAALSLVVVLAPLAVAGGKSAAGRYGAAVTVEKATDLAKVAQAPASFEGQTIRLEGRAKGVCQGQGCWIEIEGPKGVTFLAKSLDESVLVPKTTKGKKVVVQGVVTALAQNGHDHKDHEGVAAHECPTPSYVLSMQGVEVAKK